MRDSESRAWMWSDALQMIERAERLQRQLFQPASAQSRTPSWEPPIDVLETDNEILVLAALPGVDPDQIQLLINNGVLVIGGERRLPAELRTAVIHRLELPQGRFERRIALPAGRYELTRPTVINGCLAIVLHKLA